MPWGAPTQEVQRSPEIIFHELVTEGQTSDLVVRLARTQSSEWRCDTDSLAAVRQGLGGLITVELSAPGFAERSRVAARNR